MNAQLVSILAQIAACQARIAGMSAENLRWAAVGQSPAYGETDFNNVANVLDHLCGLAASLAREGP